MITLTAKLFDKFPVIIPESQRKVIAATAKAANNIQNRAAGYSRYDTGNMRAGWQQEQVDEAGYARRVFNNVYYTIFNEFGTVYMSPQPMLGPAVEETRDEYIEDLKDAYDD